MLVSKGT